MGRCGAVEIDGTSGSEKGKEKWRMKKRGLKLLCTGVLTAAMVFTTAFSESGVASAEETTKTGRLSVKLSEGGSMTLKVEEEIWELFRNEQGTLVISDPTGTQTEKKAEDGFLLEQKTGTKVEVTVTADKQHEIASYQVTEQSKEPHKDREAEGKSEYRKQVVLGDKEQKMEVGFQKKTDPDPALDPQEDAKPDGNDGEERKPQEEQSREEETGEDPSNPDAERKKLTKEGTNETSDMEALFGPKEGEEDMRLSAQAWKKTKQKLEEENSVGTDRTLYTDYTASRQWYDVTIGTNDDSGHVIWQWTEGKLYIGGRLTFCMDATTSFYEGVQYTPTDMTALGLNQDMVTRLALYQEYIYNQRTDLDDLGCYMYTQMLIWRDLNQFFGWGWPNIHIFEADYWWASLENQDRILAEAVAWVNEQQQSGKYTGHGEFFVHSYSQAQAIFWLEENSGSLEIRKESSKPEVTNNNGCYSLAGAQFGVYRDGGDYVNPDAVITTDENGYGRVDGLPAGDYWIKELKAPQGFALNKEWSSKTVHVPGGGTASYTAVNVPHMDPVTVLLEKIDKETGTGKPQGGAKLEGAEFEVKFYFGLYGADPAQFGQKPQRTWVFRTDEDGFTTYDTKYLVRGDDLYKSDTGQPGLPVGTLTIQEKKAPEGYLLNPEIFTVMITDDTTEDSFIHTYNAPKIPETVLQLDLTKTLKESKTPIKGAVFRHTKPDGSTEKVTTDQKGKAVIKGLTYGTHTIEEDSVPDGYTKNPGKVTFTVAKDNKITLKSNTATDATGTMTFTVQGNGNAQLQVEDTLAPYQLLLHKVNNKDKVLEGAEFTLYGDSSCTKVLQKKVTSKEGTLTFADLTVNTKYYLKETKAPQGYRIPVNADGSSIVYEIYTKSNPENGTFEYYVNGKKYTSSSGDFAITGTKANRIVNLKVVNQIGLQLPDTGSHATLLLVVMGIGCMTVALWVQRKKGKEEEKRDDEKL